jgi:hypothetical protein
VLDALQLQVRNQLNVCDIRMLPVTAPVQRLFLRFRAECIPKAGSSCMDTLSAARGIQRRVCVPDYLVPCM